MAEHSATAEGENRAYGPTLPKTQGKVIESWCLLDWILKTRGLNVPLSFLFDPF